MEALPDILAGAVGPSSQLLDWTVKLRCQGPLSDELEPEMVAACLVHRIVRSNGS